MNAAPIAEATPISAWQPPSAPDERRVVLAQVADGRRGQEAVADLVLRQLAAALAERVDQRRHHAGRSARRRRHHQVAARVLLRSRQRVRRRPRRRRAGLSYLSSIARL